MSVIQAGAVAAASAAAAAASQSASQSSQHNMSSAMTKAILTGRKIFEQRFSYVRAWRKSPDDHEMEICVEVQKLIAPATFWKSAQIERTIVPLAKYISSSLPKDTDEIIEVSLNTYNWVATVHYTKKGQ